MRRKATAVVVGVVVFVGGAHAHEMAVPKVERVRVSPSRVEVRIEYGVDARRSADVRRVYDRDGSGTLDEVERELLRAWLRLVAARHLTVALDGRRLGIGEESAVFLGLDEKELHATFVLGTTLATPISAGPHVIELTDRDRDARAKVAVTIQFVEPLAATPGAVASGLLEGTASSLAVPFLAP